jgi:hypothetical protein
VNEEYEKELAMAYYLVNYNDRHFVNRALLKRIFRAGDAGIAYLIAQGTVKATRLLDLTVYDVTKRCDILPTEKDEGVIIQDVTEQLAKLRKVPECKRQKKRLEQGGEILPRSYRLKCFDFVPLEDIGGTNKYRWVLGQPYITVFNKKYIAVDAEVI